MGRELEPSQEVKKEPFTPGGDTSRRVLQPAGGRGAILATCAPPPAEQAAQLNKLLEGAMTKVLGRPPRVSLSTIDPLVDIYEDTRVQKLTDQISTLVDDGEASVELLAGWRRFLFAEQYGLPLAGKGEQSATPADPAKPRQIVNGVVVEQMESLRNKVSSAVFMGPSRTHVMLGKDSVWDMMNMEAFVEDLIKNPIPFAQFQLRIEYK